MRNECSRGVKEEERRRLLACGLDLQQEVISWGRVSTEQGLFAAYFYERRWWIQVLFLIPSM